MSLLNESKKKILITFATKFLEIIHFHKKTHRLLCHSFDHFIYNFHALNYIASKYWWKMRTKVQKRLKFTKKNLCNKTVETYTIGQL